MKLIESALDQTTGYLISIERDTVNSCYFIKFGIPKKWVYDSNNDIECEVLHENESGSIIKISPKNDNIVIDDLIEFSNIIVETNERIAKKEEEFKERMNVIKLSMEIEAKEFFTELDALKETSFKVISDNFANKLHSETAASESNVSEVNTPIQESKETQEPEEIQVETE